MVAGGGPKSLTSPVLAVSCWLGAVGLRPSPEMGPHILVGKLESQMRRGQVAALGNQRHWEPQNGSRDVSACVGSEGG